MTFQYDLNKIFAELEQQVREKQKQNEEINESKKNNSIESPEDAQETQEVAPATLKISEDIHGGDEASKEIKDSPNLAIDGVNKDKEHKGQETENNNNNNNEEKYETKEKTNTTPSAVTNTQSNPNTSKTSQEDLQKVVEKLFNEKKKKQEDFKIQNRQEYIKKYILEIIKKISAQHSGIDKQDGVETYDKKQMLKHMLKHQNHKLLGDKYDLKDARYVQFFIDTSGVYGCGSNRIMNKLIPVVINILERQGYECYIAACGNGFYQKDMYEDEYYGTRKTLESYKAGKVNKISCPTPQTAAQMANQAEFSIVLADFDGLSSICEMANLCKKDKKPYFLCTEDRYPWEDPTLHDWVSPDLCNYDPELVYDVSINGNPTLEQYEDMQYDDYEYEQNDEFEQDYEYDD